MLLRVNKSFDTRVEKSSRVLEVAESFGLGLSDKRFVIYEDLEIEVNDGDILYITGQSGSGKSLLLRDVAQQLREGGKNVISIDEVPLLDVPLVDQIGSDTREALELMSQAGLNDAYVWVRKPSELSDGQRYRFRLAKVLESGANVWVADEFAAVLDRETAKIVAFNISKAARTRGATLVVATTHTDLTKYLGPTLTVEKLYGERVDLTKYEWLPA
ncbi:ATP-binding cassette domain-containing protein [Dyella telluris]|uniref:AAA family ATPase n=1 Tax=Dyella telluris TaxID=2763498 RepID=A0A7G8Q4H0_9GAMM|nr:AAA family ATPase [Dyella telluris]QNK01678.1 AAA family ATPase [Dyella telluris]